jgi:hypothetical protein
LLPQQDPTQDNWDDNTFVKGIDPETQAEMLKLPKGYHWCGLVPRYISSREGEGRKGRG